MRIFLFSLGAILHRTNLHQRRTDAVSFVMTSYVPHTSCTSCIEFE